MGECAAPANPLAPCVPCAIRVWMKIIHWIAPLLSVSLLVSCQPAERHEAEVNDARNAVGPERSALPTAEPPLDREALLLAVIRAASAAGLGEDDRQAQNKLDGDRFELRLRFGCPGAAGRQRPGGAFNVRYDAEDRTLRLRAAPNVGADHPLIAAAASQAVEAVEGFWVGRPWLLSPDCPAVRPQSAPATPTEAKRAAKTGPHEAAPAPRVAIAQFFTDADPRTRRRNQRAYEAISKLAVDEAPSAQGYDLVLSGRLKKLPNGRVVACAVESEDVPPACIISAQFDRVWIERPDSRETLAEWGNG